MCVCGGGGTLLGSCNLNSYSFRPNQHDVDGFQTQCSLVLNLNFKH